MKDKEKTRLLKRALKLTESISDQLDRAYFAHCKATGIDPDIKRDTARYQK
jgi:hypothetical protein